MTEIQIVVNEFNLDAIGDEWEDLAGAARTVAEAHDRNRWVLGDIGQKVVRRYGEQSLKQFAADVKKVRPSTMYDYTRTSGFYPEDTRDKFPALSWSHYREAMRLKDLDDALAVLTSAQDADMTVDALKAVVNEQLDQPAPLHKIAEFDATPEAIEAHRLLLGDAAVPAELATGERYVFRVYQRGKQRDSQDE